MPTLPAKHRPKLFKWRHFKPEIILLCVRWYLRYSLSYRDLEEMMVERGLTKRRVNPGIGFWSFDTAWRTLQGYEAMHQLRKGQVEGTSRGDISSQIWFVSMAFGLTA